MAATLGATLGAALGISLLSAPAGVAAPGGCPTDEALSGEIDRMGGARALAATGTGEVDVDEIGMRIVLRGRDGTVLGMRQVAAPDACQERAVLAAVVIVAWLGEWAHDEPAAPIAAVARPAPAVAAAPAFTPAGARAGAGGDVAAFAFGARDGDAATWGAGAQAGYGLGQRLALTALGEVTGERTRRLGPGEAAYRVIRFGIGLGARWNAGRVFVDAALVPEALIFAVRAQGFPPTVHGASAWGLAADGRVRVGLRRTGVTPFVYAGAGYALATTRLTLDDRPDAAATL